jgi:hypothetical protein
MTRTLLDDCDLDGIDSFVGAPFQRKKPEEDWLEAYESKLIPASLFDLYRRANYLSFGSAPPFFLDSDNVLFSYFGLSLRSVMESLVDGHEHVAGFIADNRLVYDPVKKLLGEPWDKDANRRARTHFRDLLMALQTSLDAIADLIAIFFPGAIKGLEAGRAQFSKIEVWLTKPLTVTKLIVTPTEFFVNKVHDVLNPLINTSGPEKDWLPLMRMLRNKAAHLGTPLFRQIGLPRKIDHRQVAFIPRQWPYLWEQQMKPTGHKPATPLKQLLIETLIHQDIESYCEGLVDKIKTVIAAITEILNQAYDALQESPFNGQHSCS